MGSFFYALTLKVGMDRLGEDDCLGDNVDSFLSHDDAAGPSDARSRCMASAKGVILWLI
jgi:hypothetical protein